MLVPDVCPRLYGYLGAVIGAERGISVAIGGAADHVHLLAALYKDKAVTASIRDIKANSSRWMKQTFPHLADFAWQVGYGAFSISVTGLDRVKQYLAQQEEHHRTVSFQEELVVFLRQHGIAYDERYLWE